MAVEQQYVRSPDGVTPPDDDLREFLGLLNELKATGCTLLVVGDSPRRVFARASEHLFGSTEALRYRLLTVTDAPDWSVAARLPDPEETRRPLAETTRVVNHAATPRSLTADADGETPAELVGIPETRVVDPELEGLQNAIVEAVDEFERRKRGLEPADVRVGIDSLVPLLDHYHPTVVRRCLRTVGDRVRDANGMAHYVLPRPYDSEMVAAFADDVDAIIELRSAAAREGDHDAEERWHVPRLGMTTAWTPL